jgi:thiol-disulfide isomerase/thioredoxin
LNDVYVELNKSFDSLVAQQKHLSFSDALNYKRNLAANFIRNNTSSVVSVQLLKDYYHLVNEANDTSYYSLVHILDTSLQQLFYVKEMRKEAIARNAMAIGKPAPLAQLSDSCGRDGSLFKAGEYTLIDFWASWCVSCRKENPDLLKLYKKYHEVGFNITGVSLDVNKARWLNAVRQDKLLWPQLSDLKGWKSSMIQTYGIKAIPMNYLVNKEGIIIAKNLYAEQLDILLNGLLSGQTTELQNTKSQTLF